MQRALRWVLLAMTLVLGIAEGVQAAPVIVPGGVAYIDYTDPDYWTGPCAVTWSEQEWRDCKVASNAYWASKFQQKRSLGTLSILWANHPSLTVTHLTYSNAPSSYYIFDPHALRISCTLQMAPQGGYVPWDGVLVQDGNDLQCYGPADPSLATMSVGGPARDLGTEALVCDNASSASGKVVVGDPIDLGTGAQVQVETDFEVPGNRSLTFQRFYSSLAAPLTRPPLGLGWRHSLDYRIVGDPATARAVRPSGSSLWFASSGGQFRPISKDITATLVMAPKADGTPSGWTLTLPNGDQEVYNDQGYITEIHRQEGGTLSFAQNMVAVPPQLTSVTDNYGRKVSFAYNSAGQLITVTPPVGAAISYTYGTKGGLAKLYAGGLLRRAYLYEEAGFSPSTGKDRYLTGILDATNARFATLKYDTTTGKAIYAEHGGGALGMSVSYGANSVVATNSLGATATFTLDGGLGVMKPSVATVSCPTCSSNLRASRTYDAQNNIASSVDKDGVLTCYQYDLTRNLETRRVSGLDSATDTCAAALTAPPSHAQVTTTEWSDSARIPTRTATPNQIVSYTYDDENRVTSRTVQVTADATGAQGFDAAPVGSPRTLTHAYDTSGKLVTVGPADANPIQSTYDSQGNLATHTDEKGLTTVYSNYDASGRVGKITYPTGLVVTYLYYSNGRVRVINEGGEQTLFGYTPNGKLELVRQPDGHQTWYRYDNAQRLTSIKDATGAGTVFTLDAEGNVIREDVVDSTGAVVETQIHTYDALSRVTQDVKPE
jgi:YD repeat-containing protein